MEDSDGIFGKRRRNIMIVGILIIIVVVMNPKIEMIKIFEIEFDFTNQLFLWAGITLWLAYALIRAYSYYRTHLNEVLVEKKRNFIYWQGQGQAYWLNILELSRLENENIINNNNPHHQYTVITNGNSSHDIETYINMGIIPGVISYSFDVEQKNKQVYIPVSISRAEANIDFKTDANFRKYFSRRKRSYRINEAWWEYNFTVYFSLIVICFLIFGWAREIFF